jgi:hypothetical protein
MEKHCIKRDDCRFWSEIAMQLTMEKSNSPLAGGRAERQVSRHHFPLQTDVPMDGERNGVDEPRKLVRGIRTVDVKS